MEQSHLRLIKRSAEYLPVDDFLLLPRGIRGIYVLYKFVRKTGRYNVVYVGMTRAGSGGGVRGRLRKHKKKKAGLWTHFSVYEVWDNIRDDEIVELEGIFRHLYKFDTSANKLNIQRGYRKLKLVKDNGIENWS